MFRADKERRQKLPAVPITEDLKKFRDYLVANVEEYKQLLQQHVRPEHWVFLAKCTMVRLLLFNGRRRNEVRELRVDEYLHSPKWASAKNSEMSKALSTADDILMLLVLNSFFCAYVPLATR